MPTAENTLTIRIDDADDGTLPDLRLPDPRPRRLDGIPDPGDRASGR